MDDLDPRHGTRRGYYAHRKDGEPACVPCKRAAAAAEAARQLNLMRGRNGRLDATGTRRRLQALVWMGWNWVALGEHIGSNEVMVKRWAERDQPGAYVFPDTAARVATVYERLSMSFPPESTPAERNAASRARNRARRNGWMPPLAFDDIDDPNDHGTGIRTTDTRDLLTEWHDLRDAGESIEQAARRLGITVGAIERAEFRARRKVA